MNIFCLSPLDNAPDAKRNLAKLGDLIYVPQIGREELAQLVRNCSTCVIFCNPNIMSYRLDKHILSAHVVAISTASTGTDHIDMDLCKNLGIRVFSLAGDTQVLDKISSTAEMAFGLMISLIRKIPSAFNAAKNGKWEQVPLTGRQLDILTMGVVGYGRLGSKMAKYCEAFDMEVMVCDPYKISPYPNISLIEMSKVCDVVSLHVHLSDETRYMIDNNFLNGRVKYIVNTSRGAIVKEDHIIQALEKHKLIGYVADVVEDELGNISNSEIIKRSNDLNIIITPHIAGTTREAHLLAFNRAVDNIKVLVNNTV